MKHINNIMAFLAVSAGFLAVSCEDQPDAFKATDGVPTVHFVRYADQDVVITQAFMEENICLVGDNLRSINQLWFNDQQATLNTSYMTDNTLLVSVPKTMAVDVTDKIYMITPSKDTVTYDFKVLAPVPTIKSMKCEYVKAGETAVIYGDYFTDSEEYPLTVQFEGGATVKTGDAGFTFTKTEIRLMVPDDALPGAIKITTSSGTSRSSFHFRDQRGLITDFDGTTDVVPQGWNIKATYSDVDGISGQYVQLGPSTLGADDAWNEELKLPFWCGNWNGDPMSITSGPGVPICNIIDFTDYAKMGIKFELYIPKSNPWSAGAMQIIFTNSEQCANDSWQNNTYIQPDNGLCRALYIPWAATGSFDTNDEWITVTIPFSEFIYNADGTAGKVPLAGPNDFASLVIWPWSGGVEGTECTPIFRYDNIRAVPIK